MTKPTVYVLVGLPASGKSTWYSNQDWADDCVYVSTDWFVDEYAKQMGKTYNEVFKDYMPTAVELMIKVVEEARELNMNIIWDQTSVTVKSRRKKFNMLPNYKHVAVVFNTPEDTELNRRLASRPGKNIPDYVIKQMTENFEMPTVEEGYDEVWIA